MNDAIKEVLRMFPYGFYAITSRADDNVNAMVANWVTQVSFEPRLMAIGLAKSSHSHGVIQKGGVFAINLFNEADAEAIKPYTKGRAKNPEKMKGANYSEAPITGCPILAGSAGYVECKVIDFFDIGGDHDILVGEVVGAGVIKPGEAGNTLTLPDLGWSYAG
jgi:flavin reductase (DIM6/NTAB) family NADH-FMN oxidoreductase RutF